MTMTRLKLLAVSCAVGLSACGKPQKPVAPVAVNSTPIATISERELIAIYDEIAAGLPKPQHPVVPYFAVGLEGRFAVKTPDGLTCTHFEVISAPSQGEPSRTAIIATTNLGPCSGTDGWTATQEPVGKPVFVCTESGLQLVDMSWVRRESGLGPRVSPIGTSLEGDVLACDPKSTIELPLN